MGILTETDWDSADQDEEQAEKPGKLSSPLVRAGSVLILSVMIILAVITALQTFRVAPPDISTPSGATEEFIHRLVSHNFDRAGEQLSSQVSQKVSPADLRLLFRHFEGHYQGIYKIRVDILTQKGDNAIASLRFKLDSGNYQSIQIPLHKENGVWKIASIQPLWKLVLQLEDSRLVTY
jgi:hypothetical protein